jgi:phage FluMu protein Com
VPSERCPHCGRLLSRGFVASLADRSVPCPRCGADLDVTNLATDVATAPDEVAAVTAASDEAASDTSVRPPDLPPDTVRDDVLAGWDVGLGPADMARWRDDHRPFPVDTVVVGGAAAAGLVLGVVLDRRRGRGAVLGAVVGAIAGAATRRVWRLEP